PRVPRRVLRVQLPDRQDGGPLPGRRRSRQERRGRNPTPDRRQRDRLRVLTPRGLRRSEQDDGAALLEAGEPDRLHRRAPVPSIEPADRAAVQGGSGTRRRSADQRGVAAERNLAARRQNDPLTGSRRPDLLTGWGLR